MPSQRFATAAPLAAIALLANCVADSSNKETAAVLNLSLYTVETHRANILEKLNLKGTPELILYAVRKGVIS